METRLGQRSAQRIRQLCHALLPAAHVGGRPTTTAGAATAAAAPDDGSGDAPREGPVVVSTWGFGQPANDIALRAMQGGASALDAIEKGIQFVELTTEAEELAAGRDGAAGRTVGLTGAPNAASVHQVDACIMNGLDHQAGSVAGVEGVLHPISLARRVMEGTRHVMLVGRGARWFAEEEGLTVFDDAEDEAQYRRWRAARQPRPSNDGFGGKDQHDTIALLVRDPEGNLAGGCSTSGQGDSHPGRVGDSPIIGSGLYVDNAVGAAGCTGLGENIMRHCAVVEHMRQGMTPTEACAAVLARCRAVEPAATEDLAMNIVALDTAGRFGAAGAERGGFPFSVATQRLSEVRETEPLTGRVVAAQR